ncbi:hypothetical protein PO124_18660 [Bacillus licheniformis]|nr:hypothetical protein [Bacillus licheniformis]
MNGRFSNGSVVRILDQEGEEIGLGVVNFPHPSFVNGRRIRIRKQPLPHRLSLTEKRLSVI